MKRRFDTMMLPKAHDTHAPDGAEVRKLLDLNGGGMAHFQLGAGRVSRAVAHHSVDELWYVLRGTGQMWRRQGDQEETTDLRPGVCVSIPVGTHFQFRCSGATALGILGATIPPWPGSEEAYEVKGVWEPDPG